MRSLLAATSASGTVILVINLSICVLCRNKIKAKWKRILLFLAMVYYLIPVAYYKYDIYKFIVENDIPIPVEKTVEGVLDVNTVVYKINKKIKFMGNQKILIAFLAVSAIISVSIILYRIYLYRNLKKTMGKYSFQSVSEEEQRIFTDAKRELSLKKKIRLNKSSDILEPVMTGIIRPSIWLPEKKYSESELEKIFRHELAHIKHHDLLVYAIGLVIIAVHWFNPFCYLLLPCINIINEQYSDEVVVSHMNHEEKLKYCEMIIKSSQEKNKKIWMSFNFSGQKKRSVKRRIDFIMMEKKKRLLIAIAAGLIGNSAGIVTAFAYEAPQMILLDEQDSSSEIFGEEGFWLHVDDEIEAMPFDDFFTDDANQIFPADVKMRRSSCSHNYVEGTRTVHIRKGEGCITNYYYAKRCTLCGSIVNGTLYKSLEYKVCPH